MARLPVIAAAVLAIAASAPVICTTTSPASAQGWRDRDGDTDRDLRDLLRDRIRTRQDLRDLIVDLIQDRQDMRGPSGAVVARRETVTSSPGACGPRTGICSSSFAGACVATEHGPETACSDLIALGVGVRKHHAPAMSQSGMTIRRKSSRFWVMQLNLLKSGDLR
jgi:hypothetical protein